MPTIKSPRVRGWARHPLMQGITGLQNLVIREAFLFDLEAKGVPRGVPRLMEIDQQRAVLFSLRHQSFTHLILTFPLIGSGGQWTTSWPFDLSFFLFMHNVLLTLGNVGGKTSLQPGEVKVIRAEAGVKEARVLDPRKRSVTLNRGSRPDFLYQKTETPGVYQIWWQDRQQSAFAVNLLDANESNITARASIGIGSERVVARQPRQQSYEIWKLIALLALGLLIVEWIVSS